MKAEVCSSLVLQGLRYPTSYSMDALINGTDFQNLFPITSLLQVCTLLLVNCFQVQPLFEIRYDTNVNCSKDIRKS